MNSLKLSSILIILIILSSCKSYVPFKNRQERNKKVQFIKEYVNITKKELNFLKKEDSLIFEVSKSVLAKIDSKLIERRLDSFLQKNYTKRELFTLLKVDRFYKGKMKVEIQRDIEKAKNYIKVDSINKIDEVFKEAINNIDKSLKVKSKKDSLY